MEHYFFENLMCVYNLKQRAVYGADHCCELTKIPAISAVLAGLSRLILDILVAYLLILLFTV